MRNEFLPIELRTGELLDLGRSQYPTKVYGLRDEVISLDDGATHYGMIVKGGAILHDRLDRYRLRAWECSSCGRVEARSTDPAARR